MNSRIIYPTDDGGVKIEIPAPEWLAQEGNTMEVLAQMKVPPIVRFEGTGEFKIDEETGENFEILREVNEPRTYKIVDAADIPTDRTFRNAWEYSE
jgi:hypothetical protein